MLIEKILNMCCRHFGVTSEQIVSQSRKASLVRPRHISMAAMHRAGLGMMEIARAFNRDHSCVSNALTKITHHTTGARTDRNMLLQVKYLTGIVEAMLDNEKEYPLLEGSGFTGLTCLPTYQLRLSTEESGWLHWMWMARADVHRFNGGWILNAKEAHEAWQKGRSSVGSGRLQAIMERVQASHSHVLIIPLALEEKCPNLTTLPASSLAETARTKTGSSSPTPSAVQ